MESFNVDNYIFLLNWYVSNLKWDMVDKLREIIRDMGLLFKRVYSWIEFYNKIYVFGIGDVFYLRFEKLYWEL